MPTPDVDKLVDRLKTQKGITIDYAKIEGANHFYTEGMGELFETIESYLDKRIPRIVESG